MSAAPRPLPLNTILSVAGISFHQEVAATLSAGQDLILAHTPNNAYDANAVEVRTRAGAVLGHVPSAAAARMAASLPGGVWRAQIREVLGTETIGVRLWLGPAVGIAPAPGVGGLRHSDDGYPDDDATYPAAEPLAHNQQATTDTDTGTGPVAGSTPALNAYTRGGRLLGTVTALGETKTTVLTAAGVTASYPNSLVVTSSSKKL